MLLDAEREPNVLCALWIVVASDRRSTGLSSLMVRSLRDGAARHHLAALYAPVAPSRKCDYPRSIIITGTVADWQQWTGLPMPGTGHYVVPRALAPIDVDHERDLVSYTEPNVWVRHEIR
jgi:hypothetical protein